MAIDHPGENGHPRVGRVPAHGPGERVIDATVPANQEPEAASQRREPEVEDPQDGDPDVPGVKKKLR